MLAFVLRRPATALEARIVTSPTSGRAANLFAGSAQVLVTLLILVFLILYTLLVGASASVVRACIMGGIAVIALQLGRQSVGFIALAVAVFLMTLANPYVLWDVGFQLSVLATLGLLICAPRIERRLASSLQARTSEPRARKILNFSRDALIVTSAVFVFTAPLIILYFHRVSLIGFLTNLLILPVQPPIMIFGGAATLLQMLADSLGAVPFVGIFVGALAQGVAWLAYIFLQYTILVVQATAAIPFGSFEVARIDTPLVILFYAALFAGFLLGFKRTGQLLLSRVWLAVGVLALATMFVWTTALASPDARTRISFVAAGEGDATFIRTGDDYRILINGTGEPNTLLSHLGNQLPPWDWRLDLVVATHLDNDNLSSLNEVLERYDVGQVLEPPAPARPGVSYEKWRELTGRLQIERLEMGEAGGMQLRAGAAGLQVVDLTNDPSAPLGAGSGRRTNVVLRISVEEQMFLIAPTLTAIEQRELIESAADLDADVAVLPNAMMEGWLERVTPETVILFVGRRPQDKPTADTLKLLEETTVLRTDERETITVVLDGERMQILAEK